MAVVQAGSFSAAAEALHVAQSAVSIAMKELERELGTKLFLRAGRGVRLTSSGCLLKDRVTPAMRLLRGIKDEIRDLENQSMGQLRIAAPAMITQFALRHLLPAFMRQHPRIRLRVFQAGALEIESLVRREGLDLGLTVYRQGERGVDARLLWSLDNIACTAADSGIRGRISWQKLLGMPLAVYPPGHHQRELMEKHALALGMPLKIALEAENPVLLIAAVRAGHAVTTLPLPAIEHETQIRPLRLPQHEGDQLPVGVCWPTDRPLSRAAIAMMDYLKAYSKTYPSLQG